MNRHLLDEMAGLNLEIAGLLIAQVLLAEN